MSKLAIEKSAHELIIRYRWRSLIHFFLLFFFLFWDGFLVVWYSIALSEGIWIMAVFPLIHVTVGVVGTYYVIAGFLNTTVFTITKSQLRMHHEPLPWLKNNLTIELGDARQFYVKEKVTRGKNGMQTSYQLRYLDKDKNDKNIFPYGFTMSSEDVQKMERLIEEFIGMRDFSVPGEYGGKSVQTTSSKQEFQFPQARKTSTDPLDLTLYDLSIHGVVDYQDKSWQVKDKWQYDTETGESYVAMRLVTDTGQMQVFFQGRETALILSEKKLLSFAVQSEEPLHKLPDRVKIQDGEFFKANTVSMTKFDVTHTSPLFNGELVFYTSQDHQKMLRLELKGGSIAALYLGEVLEASAFSHILPPTEGE